MNEITKRQTALELMGIEPEKIAEIKSPAIRSNVEARKGFPIRSLLTSEIKDFLSEQMEAIMQNLGQKNSTDDIILSMVREIPPELNRSYFNWTREEIAGAWRLGSLGRLGGGEVHISARNLFTWLNQYDEQHRKPAYRKLKDLKALNDKRSTKTPKTDKMTEEQKKTALNEGLEIFRQGELKGGSFYYKLLLELGLITMTKEKAWDYIGKANYAIIQECKEMQGSPTIRATAKGRIHQIKQIVQDDPKSVPDFVKARSQQLVVEDYFRDLPKDYVFK